MKKTRPYQADAIHETWTALKESDKPVLLMASVGAGKSLMLAEILLRMQRLDKSALCLVNNAELVRNNCETFREQGGNASIYCAALNSKDLSASIVFGTPQSVLNGINKQDRLATTKFNLIVVDEAHAINYLNHRSTFMRILRHYKGIYNKLRVLGATGTNFRFKGHSIVGEECLFQSQVGNITTEQLINNNYLIKPEFEVNPNLVIDFSRIKVKTNGQFDKKELEEVVNQNARLTRLICKQLMHIMATQQRFGVFIFATTRKHAYEILSYLPPEQSAIILGNTSQEKRTDILNKARKGEIKYLVNISIISIGVDIPAYDTLAYLRPTESLVLLVQTMGRALRLSPDTGKQAALILDYAGNIERHRDWDDPILLDALEQTIDKDQPYVMKCPKCMQLNTETARRCIGIINKVRCDYYFEFKRCEGCDTRNDITARYCRACEIELIDPNDKLSLDITSKDNIMTVHEAIYKVSGTAQGFRVNCLYKCIDADNQRHNIYEGYVPSTPKAKNYFYGTFVRKHIPDGSLWYPYLTARRAVERMLHSALSPTYIAVVYEGNIPKIKKRYFDRSPIANCS